MILVHQLSGISKNGWRYTKDRLTHPGLTNAAYDICGVIHLSGTSNQEYIARQLKMDKSSVAKVVNKCVNDGLIERKVNPENRREYILSLTVAGCEAVQELMDLVSTWQEEALSVLSEKEKEDFLDMLKKIRTHTDEMI